jgi:inner membrane protein
MDSLSQLALGAAVGVAVMGRRTALWKAALWGGVCGTLPDLDAFIDHGDPVSNMTLHRADSHALFWLSLASPLLAAGIARVQGEWSQWRRWWLAVWLALVTHPLLDWMTVYGTQLARPFSTEPFAVGSIFIIDPLYTLPLLVGVLAALRRGDARGLRWNQAGLLASTAYLGWSVVAQQQVTAIAEAAARQQGLVAERMLVTPTPFNTVLWRVVVVTRDAHHEGFYSLLDAAPVIKFDRFDLGAPLHASLAGLPAYARMAWFSRGFYKLSARDGELLITDLRMGQEPNYIFSFALAKAVGARAEPLPVPRSVGRRPTDIGAALSWVWQRAGGQLVDPPR